MSRRLDIADDTVRRARAGQLISLVVMLAGAVLLSLPTSHAQAQAQEAREQQTREVLALRESVFQGLAKAQELMEAEDYAGARRELDQIRAIQDLNSYERGQLLYFTGLIDYQQDNIAAAVRAFEQVVALPDLPAGFRADTMWALVQLAMAAEEYRKVIEYGRQWLATAENPSGDPFYLLAVAHFQLQEYPRAVEMINRAIEIAERDGRHAREDWYGLLRAALHEQEDYRRLREVLELMAARWPKKEYWLHLSAVYSELGMEDRQLAALEAMYEAGWMDRESEILQLAQLYMLSNGAYKGARLIEKSMSEDIIERNERNYRLLAQAWVQAQDDRRSIPPLLEAAQRASGGELYVQLAQSYLNLYDYEECVRAARTGISRGELRQPGAANLVLGTCLVELQRYDQAREAFRAARADSRSRVSADRWLDFIEREVARKRDLESQLARMQSG